VLLLWDIDGTMLIRAADDHRDAIHAAIRRVYRVPRPEEARVEAAGRTDPSIARQIVTQLGVPAARFEERLTDFKRVAAAEYAQRCRPDLSANVAPGIPEALGELATRDGTIASLVTGNLEAIAHVKLARAGIGRWFARGQGGFGSDHEDRTELPAIARARAGRDGAAYPRERTVVTGDTPRDVACAQADGVRCVAVTTGPYGADALTGADLVVSSAWELPAAILSLNLPSER
jgi:phosphoglycolate phosphatase